MQSEDLTAAFRALAEPRRIRTLRLLLEASETMCGCELADVKGVAAYQASRDLATLRGTELVRDHGRAGTWIHDEPLTGTPVADAVAALVRASTMHPDDLARLALRLELREQVGCVLGAGHPEVLAVFAGA